MTKMFRILTVLTAVLCLAACDKQAEGRYDLLESDILLWEHVRNTSGDDIIVITLLPESAERFNTFTEGYAGKVIDIYFDDNLLSSPQIRAASTSNLIYLAGFEGNRFKRMVDVLPPALRKNE